MPGAGVGYSLELNRFESVALPLAQQGIFGPSVFRDARKGQESESVEAKCEWWPIAVRKHASR